MRSRRNNYVLAAIGLALAVSWLVWTLVPHYGEPSQGDSRNAISPPSPSTVSLGHGERENVDIEAGAKGMVAWKIQTDLGNPVPQAFVEVAGIVSGCDSRGVGQVSSDLPVGDRVAAWASAPGHDRWVGNLEVGASTTITLHLGGAVSVRVVDDYMNPVRGAEVWLATEPIAGDAPDNDARIPRGVTGADGLTLISGVPYGLFLLHARHDTLVHSHTRLKQMNLKDQCTTVKITSRPVDVTMHMTMPYACGIQVIGGDVLSCSFSGTATGYSTPENQDGAFACRQLKKRLEEKFPGAKLWVTVRDFVPALPKGYGAFEATLWIAERQPVQRTIALVPLSEFLGPVRIAVENLPPSDQFGGIMVQVRNSGGLPMDRLKYTLGVPFRLWKDGTPQMRHMDVPVGRLATVPVGVYDLVCEGLFESQVEGLNRRNLEVKRLDITEIVIDSQTALARCRLDLTCNDGSPAPRGGIFAMVHPATGMQVSQLVSHFGRPIELWVPAGIISLRAEAYGPSPETKWFCSDEAVQVEGGTLDAAQVIARTFALVKR